MPTGKAASLLLAVVFVGVGSFMMFSPWGVHFYGEVLFPEDEPKAHAPSDHPMAITETKTARTVPLPATVMQPSGIDYDAVNDRFFIVTDQAEIIDLGSDLQTILASKVMSNKPLFFRQGTIESNDFYDNRLFVSGDLGTIDIWQKDGRDWRKTGEIGSASTAKVGSEGMAINPANGDIYVGSDAEIHVLDMSGKYLWELDLKIDLKAGRSASELIVAGLDFYDGDLYVLTEYYSAILNVNPETGQVNKVYALEGIVEGAGLAVTADAFYVVVDHELTEPSPGVKVYQR